MNRQYLEPVFHGRYPEEMKEIFGEAWPDWPQQDFELIRQPIDFLGINYYTRNVVRHEETSWLLQAVPVRQTQATYSETGWEVFPQGLTDTLVWIRDRYGDIPQYVTENGAAFICVPSTRRSSEASTSAATSPGRCSTTSNGRSAIRSASASCT